MIFQFGEYKIDVDVEKTRQFYDRAKTVSGANATGVLTSKSRRQTSAEYQDFFSALGVDMKKICECYVYCIKRRKHAVLRRLLPHLRNFTQRQKRVETVKRLYSLLGREKSNISALAEFWRFVQRPYRHAGAGFSSFSYSARLHVQISVVLERKTAILTNNEAKK